MQPRRASNSRKLLIGTAAVALLGAFFLQSVLSMRLLNASSDETFHLPAGYTYLKTGDFRLNREHPPLIKELAAIPLLFLRPSLDLEDPAWKEDPPRQIPFGVRFLYTNDADRLLFWGRLPLVLLCLVTGIYVFRWARELFGTAAALTALTLFAFSPNLLAHSHFVTMDAGLACLTIVTLYHAWSWSRTGRRLQLLLAGLALGCALGAKFSAGILLPVLAVLLALSAFERGTAGGPRGNVTSGSRRQRILQALAGGGVMLAIAAAAVWALYFFPADPLFYWKGMRSVHSNHAPDYYYFMLGEFKQGGWWYYQLVAFALKTPLPTLILLVLSVVLFRRCRAPSWLDEVYLLFPALVFTAVTCAFAANIGIRYLLPVYPLLFVFVSRVALVARSSRVAISGLAVLGLWYAGGSLAVYPDYLAYFNELAGGPAGGHRYLDDSNIDWGQDLKRLKTYMDRNGIRHVRLLYAWNADPTYYGIRWRPIDSHSWQTKPAPGYYVVSTHWLIRGELSHRINGYNADWLSRYRPYGRVGYSFYVFRFE